MARAIASDTRHGWRYNRRRAAVEEFLRCLQTGTDPRTVIEPWNQAARASLKIEPVARMRFRAGS